MSTLRLAWLRAGMPVRTLLAALPTSFWLLPLVLIALGGLPVLLLLPSPGGDAAPASVIAALQVSHAVSEAATPPPGRDGWARVDLPHYRLLERGATGAASWYRVEFDASVSDAEPWAAYLPFLYNGGSLWLNGTPIGSVLSSRPELHVRWERPFLVALPAGLLRPTGNELLLRLPPAAAASILRMPRLEVAPLRLLMPVYDRRLFWVRTMPQITVAVGILVPCFVLFIWWRRRSEVLYGLFGVAALLWAVRTLTFVLEVIPQQEWQWWRISYHAATGGFVVVMALFALRFAGLNRQWLDRALVAYALLGPLWLLVRGPGADVAVGYFWGGGLIAVGLGAVAATAWAAVVRREKTAALLLIALALAACAGVHDYMMSYGALPLSRWLPEWTQQRFFLLHHAANLLLVVMGGLLTQRFIDALTAIQILNHTLEDRVAAREAELADSYGQMAVMQQERAAAQERRRIMRDLHDGLGSKLFILLSRVERGAVQTRELSQSLRACIADMRLSLDASAAQDAGLESALADFLYRWRPLLCEAGVQPSWQVDVAEPTAWISAHATLQLLRLLQEALTNVVKHAGANAVSVEVRATAELLTLAVIDNGKGFGGDAPAGRGIANMQARAAALHARLTLASDASGTGLRLELPRIPPGAS
ncbi:sensor histidine kinase [Roseateles sp. NT4]|uniref:sensor histidine kinase n=1 Tax=Roseateles sp. NT4 TaxID=3453715 RepID=UPI003EEEC2B0